MPPRPVPDTIRITRSSVKPSVFDFTEHVASLCRRIVAHNKEYSHIDMSRIATSFSYGRPSSSGGTFASLTPLRFPNGEKETTRRGRRMRIQSVLGPNNVEMLYILTLYVPRFVNQTFREKLITLFHELWHVGPNFDGDIRRHEGRCYAHGSSRDDYDKQMGALVDRWLRTKPAAPELETMQLDYRSLWTKHKRMTGLKLPRIRLLPIEKPSAVAVRKPPAK